MLVLFLYQSHIKSVSLENKLAFAFINLGKELLDGKNVILPFIANQLELNRVLSAIELHLFIGDFRSDVFKSEK